VYPPPAGGLLAPQPALGFAGAPSPLPASSPLPPPVPAASAPAPPAPASLALAEVPELPGVPEDDPPAPLAGEPLEGLAAPPAPLAVPPERLSLLDVPLTALAASADPAPLPSDRELATASFEPWVPQAASRTAPIPRTINPPTANTPELRIGRLRRAFYGEALAPDTARMAAAVRAHPGWHSPL